MQAADAKKKRIRTILIAIIIATIPCYCLGLALLRIAGDASKPTPTALPTQPPPTAVVEVATPTFTEVPPPTMTPLPVIVPTETWTPTMTFTLLVPPTRTPLPETPTPEPTLVPTDTPSGG